MLIDQEASWEADRTPRFGGLSLTPRPRLKLPPILRAWCAPGTQEAKPGDSAPGTAADSLQRPEPPAPLSTPFQLNISIRPATSQYGFKQMETKAPLAHEALGERGRSWEPEKMKSVGF